jgi:hypothetical protein
MVIYPKRAPTSYTWSPEPEIAKKHFGFEFWLTAGLFLFLAGMTIAQGVRGISSMPRVARSRISIASASISGWLPANHISLPGYPIPQ